MNWAMDDLRAEVAYRRYGTADQAARQHIDQVRGKPVRWRRVRGGQRVA